MITQLLRGMWIGCLEADGLLSPKVGPSTRRIMDSRRGTGFLLPVLVLGAVGEVVQGINSGLTKKDMMVVQPVMLEAQIHILELEKVMVAAAVEGEVAGQLLAVEEAGEAGKFAVLFTFCMMKVLLLRQLAKVGLEEQVDLPVRALIIRAKKEGTGGAVLSAQL